MSLVQTGSCPKCGSPIYAESPWWGVNPPPPIYTCSCVGPPKTVTSTGIHVLPQEVYNELYYKENPNELSDRIEAIEKEIAALKELLDDYENQTKQDFERVRQRMNHLEYGG